MQSPGDSSDLGVSGAWLSSHCIHHEILFEKHCSNTMVWEVRQSASPPNLLPSHHLHQRFSSLSQSQWTRLSIEPTTIIWQALACGITLTNKKTPLVFGEHIVLWLVSACSTPNHKVSTFFSFLMNQTVCWLYLYLELPKQSCNISGVASGDEHGRKIGSQGHW